MQSIQPKMELHLYSLSNVYDKHLTKKNYDNETLTTNIATENDNSRTTDIF